MSFIFPFIINDLSSLPSFSKIGLFLIIWLIIWLPIGFPLALSLKWQPFQGFTPPQKLPLVASLYLFVPLMGWLTCRLEETTLADYGLPWDSSILISLAGGIGLGILGLILVFTVESMGGWVQWQGENWMNLLKNGFPLFLVALWVGITEELIFRGIFFTQLRQDYGNAIAATLSSVIFALLHLLWERKETLPQLPGLWLMGMILVAARGFDGGNLGLAWGLHSGWVWGLASLDASQLIKYPAQSPQWITGFYRQPLAGISGILCLLITGGILWIM